MENFLRHILGPASFPQVKSQVPPTEVVQPEEPAQVELPLESVPDPKPQ